MSKETRAKIKGSEIDYDSAEKPPNSDKIGMSKITSAVALSVGQL